MLLSILSSAAFAQNIAIVDRPTPLARSTWQASFGLHIAFSTDGFGLGLDADLLSGAAVSRSNPMWLTTAGPFVAADVLVGRGGSVSVGGRVATGAGGSFGAGNFPLALGVAGAGYRWAPDASGLRVDGRLRGLAAFDLGAYGTRTRGGQWRDVTALAGLNLSLLPMAYATEGRPLRTAGGILRAHGAVARPSDTARHWLRRAEDEAAAVRAFQRLVRELRAAEAPEVLVRRVERAAAEERGHTLACLAQAARHGGSAWLALPPRMPPRRSESRTDALRRIAWEAHWDGHDNEGRAAEDAARREARARDPRGRAVEHRIAREEHGHAQLGRDLLAWASGAGGATVAAAVDGPPPA